MQRCLSFEDSSSWTAVADSLRADVRIELRNELHALGLVPSDSRLAAAIDREGQASRSLANEFEPPALPTSGIFGRRWAAKVPKMMGFGAAAARAIADRATAAVPDCAIELSALLNLGVAALDTLCDHAAGRDGEIFSLLSEPLLIALCAGDADPEELMKFAKSRPMTDLAYVLELVADFFFAVQLIEERSIPQLRSRLVELLPLAYRAERRTCQPLYDSTPKAELLWASYHAAVTPFMVMGAVVEELGEPARGRATGASKSLGELVALLDDLCDLPDDALTGSLNGILLSAAPDCRGLDQLDGRLRTLADVDGQGVVREAAQEVCGRLAAFLGSRRWKRRGPLSPNERLMPYLLSWAGLTGSLARSAI